MNNKGMTYWESFGFEKGVVNYNYPYHACYAIFVLSKKYFCYSKNTHQNKHFIYFFTVILLFLFFKKKQVDQMQFLAN